MGSSKTPSLFNEFFVRPLEQCARALRRPVERRLYDRALQLYRDRGVRVVHFLHVRKAGGSAVKSALEGVALERQDLRFEMHPHRFSLKDVPAGDKVFFFLRDPLTRFVSGFWSRYRMGRPKNDIPWNREERRAFAAFATPNALALALSSDDPALRRSAVRAMRGIRHVNSCYRDWLVSAEYLRARRADVLMAGRLESLDRDFARLKGVLELDADVVLPDDGVRSHRSPGGEEKRLDATAAENIRRWYAEDYAFIELCGELGFNG
jgi:hypothetical protein